VLHPQTRQHHTPTLTLGLAPAGLGEAELVLEHIYLTHALVQTGGNQVQAAAQLGINRTTLRCIRQRTADRAVRILDELVTARAAIERLHDRYDTAWLRSRRWQSP
jgi:hypothetical protein